MPEAPCYICKTSSNIVKQTYEVGRTESSVLLGDYYEVDCPRCDKYVIRNSNPESLIGELSEQQIANISYWLRHNQTTDESPTIDNTNVNALKNLRIPSVGEIADRLIVYFSKMYSKPGQYINTNLFVPRLLAEVGCIDAQALQYIIENYLLKTKEYIQEVDVRGDGSCRYKISPKGWEYIESLKEINPDSRIGFVAMWFDESVREIYEQGIKIGIEQAGYDPLRIDFKEHNNRIDDEIIATIKRCKFLVADLTGQRGGVYFEAGYALGLGLPVIWTCDSKHLKKVHFDTRQYYFITWDRDKLNDLRDKLRYRIEATIGRGDF